LRFRRRQFDTIYQRLGVQFDHTLGESFYNPRLKALAEELSQKGIAARAKAHWLFFFEDNPQLKENPALIQKERRRFQLHHHGPGPRWRIGWRVGIRMKLFM